ncbi:hypothetical protein CP97_14784 [Aurantiacibacter atlanticus]|uniref:Uncharacterized protein n=1 Tax=Aurantiacibacter atlanticus TaxID=1648404 RepID=A0A161IUB6_9SPHN|nr:hypothetical protein [Aurantiacibacter atlanticus]ANC50470.1 hypothetical protein CP97_14784 [Aurantiacibacter atlanticus]MDF1834689.1 hypothetical protein [Alteraurantiacibacter sp. bin_em_oilr2.035]
MFMTFLVIGAIGAMLLTMVPRSTVPWQRFSSRGGAAMLIGLGLFGTVHTALSP